MAARKNVFVFCAPKKKYIKVFINMGSINFAPWGYLGGVPPDLEFEINRLVQSVSTEIHKQPL